MATEDLIETRRKQDYRVNRWVTWRKTICVCMGMACPLPRLFAVPSNVLSPHHSFFLLPSLLSTQRASADHDFQMRMAREPM